MLTNPKESYSGHISPSLIMLAENSLGIAGAAEVTIPVSTSTETLYYFYLYLAAESYD